MNLFYKFYNNNKSLAIKQYSTKFRVEKMNLNKKMRAYLIWAGNASVVKISRAFQAFIERELNIDWKTMMAILVFNNQIKNAEIPHIVIEATEIKTFH